MISFAANTVAIPWLAFLVLPFCLLGTLCVYLQPAIGELLLRIAEFSLSYLWVVLAWFAQLPSASWELAIPSALILVMTVIGFILLLLPAGIPGRWLGLIWCLPLCLYQSPRPPQGPV